MKKYTLARSKSLGSTSMFVCICIITAMLLTVPALAGAPPAGPAIGQSIGEWVLAQIFWVALVAIVIVIIKLLLTRNFVAMGITVVIGAVALVIIETPQRIQAIGNAIFSLIP